MRRIIVSLWFSFWPLLLGVLLPYFEFPGRLHLLNFFWGVVYGFGLWMIDKTVGLSIQSPLALLGLIVWPIVVSGAMFFVGWKLPQMSSRMRLALESALLLSSLFVVNLDQFIGHRSQTCPHTPGCSPPYGDGRRQVALGSK